MYNVYIHVYTYAGDSYNYTPPTNIGAWLMAIVYTIICIHTYIVHVTWYIYTMYMYVP